MRISVIIPFSGNQEKLRRILKNLHTQQAKVPDEIIVVKDTKKPILHIPYNYIEIEHENISDEHRAGHARNKGATVASGDVLVFQDGDILLGAHYIQHVREYFELQKNHILTGSFWNIDKQLQNLSDEWLFGYIHQKENYVHNKLDEGKYAELIKWLPEDTESRQFAITKELFWKIGGFDKGFVGWGCEDTEFFYRALKDFNIASYNYRRLYSFHLEHPVDMIYLMDSMKKNAEYWFTKNPEVKDKYRRLWTAFDVFETNINLRRTYNKVKAIREKSGVRDFGLLETMRAKGLWNY